MLMPFLELIFKGEDGATAAFMKSSGNPVMQLIRDKLTQLVTNNGKIAALGIICILIVTSILLKNIFLVLSYYVLNPLKNKVVNRFRSDLYDKILHLPIGYFTEKKK